MNKALELFFAQNIRQREDAAWKISDEYGIYYFHASIIRDLRAGVHWSSSRERRLVDFLKLYRGAYYPSVDQMRQAELLTQKHGITIEAADLIIQMKERKVKKNKIAEVIKNDKEGKLGNRDLYFI